MAWQGSAFSAAAAPGSVAPVVNPEAPHQRARASARVGVLEQVAPGQQVEAAQAPLVPPVSVVERDAPDEVPLALEARRVPASGQGREV